MKRFYRIDQQGQPRHVVEENGDWRLVEGDIFGQYDAGDRVAATGQVLLAPVQPSKRERLNGDDLRLKGIDKLKTKRSDVPAITHVDYSARVQTVDEARHGRYYKLMKKFQEKTGSPVIINTSFNIRGEPIVCSPEHAYRCFLATNMDVLVLENLVLLKEDQPGARQHEIDSYMAQFQLD